MPIEDQLASTAAPEQSGQAIEIFDDDAQFLANAAKRAQKEPLPEASRSVAPSEAWSQSGPETKEASQRQKVFGKKAIGIALGAGLLLGAGGVGLGVANTHALEESKTPIGSDSFMPSPDTGETWGQADAAVNSILEESGKDPNLISYEDVGTALSPALKQEIDIAGQINPGATFDATVYESTDIFGKKHQSVEIDSQKYLAQQQNEEKQSSN